MHAGTPGVITITEFLSDLAAVAEHGSFYEEHQICQHADSGSGIVFQAGFSRGEGRSKKYVTEWTEMEKDGQCWDIAKLPVI